MKYSVPSQVVAWLLLLTQNGPLVQTLKNTVRGSLECHLLFIASFAIKALQSAGRSAVLQRAADAHREINATGESFKNEVQFVLDGLAAVMVASLPNNAYSNWEIATVRSRAWLIGQGVGFANASPPSIGGLRSQLELLASAHELTDRGGLDLLVEWLQQQYARDVLRDGWQPEEVASILREIGVPEYIPSLYDMALTEILGQAKQGC